MTAFTGDPHHAEDLHAWHVLRPLLDGRPYLPWSSGALRPAGLVRLCNEIVVRGRTAIVECGSGSSTVVLARLLRERGEGALWALEHDGDWAAFVRTALAREGLDDRAHVVEAPLEGDPPWYAAAGVAALPERCDLLLVDGPPAVRPGHGRRREPALGRLGDRLTPDATVVLDDIDRPGERAVLDAWEATTNWRFERDESAGVAVGRREPSAS